MGWFKNGKFGICLVPCLSSKLVGLSSSKLKLHKPKENQFSHYGLKVYEIWNCMIISSRVIQPYLLSYVSVNFSLTYANLDLLFQVSAIIFSFSVAAPLIATLDYWPLLNRGRKNRGSNNIFWWEAALWPISEHFLKEFCELIINHGNSE